MYNIWRYTYLQRVGWDKFSYTQFRSVVHLLFRQRFILVELGRYEDSIQWFPYKSGESRGKENPRTHENQLHLFCVVNLTCHISSIAQRFLKRTDVFGKYLVGDWMKQLAIPVMRKLKPIWSLKHSKPVSD